MSRYIKHVRTIRSQQERQFDEMNWMVEAFAIDMARISNPLYRQCRDKAGFEILSQSLKVK